MDNIETTTLEDLFMDCFGGWKDDIQAMEKKTDSELSVVMKSGRKYLFGRNGHDIYLHTVKEEST